MVRIRICIPDLYRGTAALRQFEAAIIYFYHALFPVESHVLHIYIDADACPVKNEIYRVAERYRLSVTLVTNSWMRSPPYSWVKLQVVGDGLDEADDWIVEHVQQDDVVITADIPLASRCIKGGASVIGTTGKPFTEDNIGGAVAMRDLMKELRGAGEITGGPPPLSKRDKSRFLQEFDAMIQAIRRRCGA